MNFTQRQLILVRHCFRRNQGVHGIACPRLGARCICFTHAPTFVHEGFLIPVRNTILLEHLNADNSFLFFFFSSHSVPCLNSCKVYPIIHSGIVFQNTIVLEHHL